MVEILEKIPKKQATMLKVPKERPMLVGVPGFESINYRYITIPRPLNRRFLQKCGVDITQSNNGLTTKQVEEKIYQANKQRDLYIRFADSKALSIVTDQFKEIKPEKITEKASQLLGKEPKVRYFQNNESLQLNFPIETERFSGMNIVINTGDYGTYGGSGLNAVSYGITWFNNVCSNWTMFLDKTLRKGIGRIVHRGNGNNLDEKLEKILTVTQELEDKIQQSYDKYFTSDDLDNYFEKYERRGLNKGVAETIKQQFPDGMSAYDLSYKLTQLCQFNDTSDTTRAKMEFLAGEVILCYDNIKNRISEEPKPRTVTPVQNLPKRYINLN